VRVRLTLIKTARRWGNGKEKGSFQVTEKEVKYDVKNYFFPS
jgi:hypothetical protein